MKRITFQHKASQRIYDDYIKRTKRSIRILPKADQEDILMEFNSHIYEGMERGKQGEEVDKLLDILQKLGTPEEVLQPLVAEKKMDQATRTFNPLHVFKALALNITNGVSYIIFAFLYLFLFTFVFLIFAKIAYPEDVGMFFDEDGFMAIGMTSLGYGDGVREVLGHWFIPCMILIIIVLYLFITLLLRLKRTFLKK